MSISIIIPIYNVAPYVERCLQSVAEQTYNGDLECLLIDDCSSDDSLEIIERYIANYQGKIVFKIFRHNCNRGLAAVRNTGVAAAKGDFIIHVDSDDWLDSKAVELLVKEQQKTDADIVSGKAIAHYIDREELLEEPEIKDKDELMRHMAELTIDHVIWRRLIRTALYKEHRIEAESGVDIGEDHHTLPRLIYYAKKCVKLDAVVYHYNCQNANSYMGNLTYSNQVKKMKSNLASINILIRFFDDKDPVCVKQLKQTMANYTLKCMSYCYDQRDSTMYNYLSKKYFSYDTENLRRYGNSDIRKKLVKRYYWGRLIYDFIFSKIK